VSVVLVFICVVRLYIVMSEKKSIRKVMQSINDFGSIFVVQQILVLPNRLSRADNIIGPTVLPSIFITYSFL
jgi:hypothetical protein